MSAAASVASAASTSQMLIGLATGIAVLLILAMKTRIHVFVALILAALVTGMIGGLPFENVIGSITKGFGSTLGQHGDYHWFGRVCRCGIGTLRRSRTNGVYHHQMDRQSQRRMGIGGYRIFGGDSRVFRFRPDYFNALGTLALAHDRQKRGGLGFGSGNRPATGARFHSAHPRPAGCGRDFGNRHGHDDFVGHYHDGSHADCVHLLC